VLPAKASRVSIRCPRLVATSAAHGVVRSRLTCRPTAAFDPPVAKIHHQQLSLSRSRDFDALRRGEACFGHKEGPTALAPERPKITVTAARILLVFHSLLAVVLLAGAPGGGRLQAADGSFVRLVAATAAALPAHRGHAAAENRATQDDASGFGGADPDHDAVADEPLAWRSSRVSAAHLAGVYSIVILSHRPCAAPPTGPPSSLV
jgi:hypothetical protein